MNEKVKQLFEDMKDVILALKQPEMKTNQEFLNKWFKKSSDVRDRIKELNLEEWHALGDLYGPWFQEQKEKYLDENPDPF